MDCWGGGFSAEGRDHVAEDHVVAGHQPGGHPVPATVRTVGWCHATQGVVDKDGSTAAQAGHHNVSVALNVGRQTSHVTHG